MSRDHNREGFSLLAALREIAFFSAAILATNFLGSLAFSNLKSFLPENLTTFFPVQSVLYGALYALCRPILNHVFREVEAMNDVMAGVQNDLVIAQEENSRLRKFLATVAPESDLATAAGPLTVLPPATERDRIATAA
jgi:hypothetical protein